MTQKSIPERNDIPKKHKWDLAPMFDSDESWGSLYNEI